MSMLTEVTKRAVQLPTISLPKWPKLHLRRHLCNAIEAYTTAVSLSYGAALGRGPQSVKRDSAEHEWNY